MLKEATAGFNTEAGKASETSIFAKTIDRVERGKEDAGTPNSQSTVPVHLPPTTSMNLESAYSMGVPYLGMLLKSYFTERILLFEVNRGIVERRFSA